MVHSEIGDFTWPSRRVVRRHRKANSYWLAYRSLEHFLHFERGHAGYSHTGASSMYAALGDGDQALASLNTYFDKHDRRNTMYTESHPASPVMETPLSAARCVQDMLLQSHDVIRVFPAVPQEWQDAVFHNLLAEGAFEVSAVRRKGRTLMVRVKSLAGEPCKVKTDLEEPVLLNGDQGVSVSVNEEGIIALELEKDQEAVLVENGTVDDLSIAPLPLDPNLFNLYGVKK